MKRYVWLCIALFSAACADQPTAPVDAPDLAPGAPLMQVMGVQGGGVAGFDLADGSGCDGTVFGWNYTPVEGLKYSFDARGTFQTALSRSAPCAYTGNSMRLWGQNLESHFHSIAIHPPLDWNPKVDYTVRLHRLHVGAFETMQPVTVPGSGWSEVLLPFGPDIWIVDVVAPGPGFYDDLTWGSPFTDPQDKAECMNGGWESFGFKNQGQCVRFVETGRDGR